MDDAGFAIKDAGLMSDEILQSSGYMPTKK
jgi:L-2-hydroxyglutarate oxidase LhgO